MPLGTNYQGDDANPGLDATDDFGLKCFVTGNTGTTPLTDDVDNGTVTLISPAFDLTGFTDPYMRYERWFYDGAQSGNTPDDNFTVKLNNGTTTVTIENTTLAQAPSNKWTQKIFRISNYVALTNNTRLIIEASDATGGNPNVVEAGLDKFEIQEGIFTALNDLDNEQLQVLIYPNPSTGKVNIDYAATEGNVQLKVRNILGEEIITSQVLNAAQGNFTFDLSAQPQGIYFVTLQTADSEKTLKFSLLH